MCLGFYGEKRMKCQNFFRGLVLCLTLLVVNTFAQDIVAIAHIIYDGNNLYYADNESNIKYKQLKKNEDGTFTINFTQERLEGSDRLGRETVRQLRFGSFCMEDTDSCKAYLNKGHEPFLAEVFPDYKNGLDSQQVFEVWIQINADSTLTIDKTKPVIVEPAKKTIRFLAPWSNTSVVITLNGTPDYMTPVGGDYCGWFEYRTVLTPKDAYVYFKQTIGGQYVGADGLTDEEVPIEKEILLDTILSVVDTVWIYATKYSEPELYTFFPGELGDCPIKNLPVMMFDWKHGTEGDGIEGNGNPKYGVSADFGSGGCKKDDGHSIMKGMVEKELGPNGVPVPVSDFPKGCNITEHLGSWFLPEEIEGSDGNTYTNATCRTLDLSLTDDGFWFGQKNKESPEKGLFFLDDFKYLDTGDSVGTIPNPMYDNIDGGATIGTHNYGFTMKIQAQFEYVPGQYFEFLGDDDVWVFINNKLVVDIGGQHTQIEGKVLLDTIGQNNPADKLEPGQTYNFHIFYAERHKDESNFKMRTSMDLKAEASMFLTDLSKDPKLIVKDVWQKIRKTTLSCDFSSNNEKDSTDKGPSTFTLYGKSLNKSGIPLQTLDSAYYSGITISEDYTRVTVDINSISRAQALPPGKYYIRVRLRENPNDYKDVSFTIDPYELPNLAFANIKDSSYFEINNEDPENPDTTYHDQYWNPLGDSLNRSISSDVTPINFDKNEKLWAGHPYPVNIMYAEEWASIYNGISVSVTTSDTNLIVCDSMDNPITSVILVEGRASFFVKGIDKVTNGTLTVSTEASKNKSINWTKINIEVPPVPQIEAAYIFDRSGDGRSDSIWIQFSKALDNRTVIDSVKFIFEANMDDYKNTKKAYKVDKYKAGDISASITAKDNFSTEIFTGAIEDTNSYAHSITIWYTYTDEDNKKAAFDVSHSLTDKVGPVVIAAEIKYLKDGNTQLTLGFSEMLKIKGATTEDFRFHCWKNERQDSLVKTASEIVASAKTQWKLIFPKGAETDVIPIVGDSVRFTPPSQRGAIRDLVSVGPHEKNPWVRITGEQKVTVTSPKVISLSKENKEQFDSAKVIIQSPKATVPKLVATETTLSAEQVGAIYGTQGHYLGDLDMAELVENEIAEIVKAVQASSKYVNEDEAEEAAKNGTTPKSYTVQEIVKMLETNQITLDEAEDDYNVDPVILDAYENGLLSSQNLAYYASGTKSDIQRIVSSVADKTELYYEAIYYSHLGHFVNRHSDLITCNDDIFKEGGRRNCLENEGRLFLAWNMRSENGKLAATGVYIARLHVRIKVNTKVITDRTQDFLWGVRRGKVNAIDLGI